MKSCILERTQSTIVGTFGTLLIEGDRLFTSVSLELPWRGNAPGLSCIPSGIYPCVWGHSPTKGWCYKVQDVPDRTGILIHPANWAGDTLVGKYSELKGCIALGSRKAQDLMTPAGVNQIGITNSRSKIEEFHNIMRQQPFTLTIR